MASDLHHIVELENVQFKRDDQIILNHVNISAEKGKVTAIMGPSGSGKTTILKLIGGQLNPGAGKIRVFNQPIDKLSRHKLYKLRRSIGMLFQSGALFSDLTVFDNVAFPLREHTTLPESMIRDLVVMKLEAVGLRGARDFMPAQLSGGMARRVALARALALDPMLIMFDEPFAGQDPITMGVLVELIRLLNDALGLTTIIVSHDVKETMSIADYVYLIAEGRVIGQGKPAELQHMIENMQFEKLSKHKKIPKNKSYIEQFLEGLPDGPVPFHYPAKAYPDDLWGLT